jgi:hypothetical protein
MKKQTYWDCMTTSDATDRKAYVKDGKQRVKLSRTVTRDCATGITEEAGDACDGELISEDEDAEEAGKAEEAEEAEELISEDEDAEKAKEGLGLGELFREGLVAWSTGGTYVSSVPTKK